MLVRECVDAVAAGGAPPGRYQLLAAINAVHTQARSARETDWGQVVALYDRLVVLDPSPIVRLNRAIALAERYDAARGLDEVEQVAEALDGYHALHATRAELLRRLGREGDARAAYDRALALTDNPAEQAYLTRRRDDLDG